MARPRLRDRLLRPLVVVGIAGALLGVPGWAPSAVPSVAAAVRSYPATIAAGRAAAARVLAESGASSLSLALVDGSKVVWRETFGAVDADGTKPGATTMYGLGSVSKTVLAVALMQLVDAGKVSLDRPVVDYVPDFTMASPEYRRITVRMLLNHTAGLPGSDYANAMTTAPFDGYQEQLLRGLRTERLKTTPGAMSVYCNDCYTLAEIVVQRVAGRPYTDHATDAVLTPLGMTHTRFPTESFPAGSYAPVLTPDGALPQEFLSLPGSGSVYSTPSDMAHLATMLMSGGMYGGKRILSAASIAEMGRDQIVSTLDPVKDNEYRYGLGWDSVAEPGLAAVGVAAWVKGGDSTDYHTGFTVAPKAKLAAVVQLAGVTASSTQAQTLGQTLILRALVERGDLTAMPKQVNALRLPTRAPTAAQLRAVEGVYLAGGGAFRIEADARGALRFARYLGDDWTPSPASFTLRSDGRFWDTKTGTKAFSTVTGWGRRYLVLRQVAGYGHYASDMVLGERLSPGPAISAAWNARLGTTYVFTTEIASSTGWQAPGMRLREIPGLQGYLYADVPGNPVPVDPATSDSMGAMTVVIPAMQGRDLNDVDVLSRDGQEWLRMGSTLRRPLDRAPAAAKGSTTVAIGDDSVAEWVRITAGGSVTTVGADAWKTFDADLAPTGEGTGDASTLRLDGGYLVVFGDAGSDVTVKLE